MPRGAQLEPAIARERGLDPVDEQRKACARLQDVELGRGVDRPVQISGASPEGVSQREQDPPHFLGFLLLEGDDVVVDLDRAERLEEQAGAAAGAAVDDARNRGAMLAADDEHVPAVAIGDDLLLEVLRRVAAAQVRLERSAQPGPLLAQAIAQARELGAGIVDHLVRGTNLAADVADFLLERRRGLGDDGEQGKAGADLPHGAARALDRCQEPGEVDERHRLEDPALDRERHQQRVEILRRLQPDFAVAQEAGRFRGRRERSRDRTCVSERLQLRQTRRAGRRLCEAAHRFDDPVVFERPQGTGVHETLENTGERQARQGNR